MSYEKNYHGDDGSLAPKFINWKTLAIMICVFLALGVAAHFYINSALFRAIRNNDTYRVQRLIRFGANVNTVDRNGQTPLIYAVLNAMQHQNIDISRLLIEEGADVDAVDRRG